MPPVETTDVIVIGAGIAGASIAAEIAAGSRVLLLERERQPGYHSTGRSAALFTETYGSEAKRALSHASRAFLQQPPPGFSPTPLLAPRGTLLVATESQVPKLRQTAEDCAGLVGNLAWLTEDEVRARVGCFAPGQVAAGLLEPDAMDIDVDALHRGYLRLFAARGGTAREQRRGDGRSNGPAAPGARPPPPASSAPGGWSTRRARGPTRSAGSRARSRSGWCRCGARRSRSIRRPAWTSAAGPP